MRAPFPSAQSSQSLGEQAPRWGPGSRAQSNRSLPVGKPFGDRTAPAQMLRRNQTQDVEQQSRPRPAGWDSRHGRASACQLPERPRGGRGPRSGSPGPLLGSAAPCLYSAARLNPWPYEGSSHGGGQRAALEKNRSNDRNPSVYTS